MLCRSLWMLDVEYYIVRHIFYNIAYAYESVNWHCTVFPVYVLTAQYIVLFTFTFTFHVKVYLTPRRCMSMLRGELISWSAFQALCNSISDLPSMHHVGSRLHGSVRSSCRNRYSIQSNLSDKAARYRETKTFCNHPACKLKLKLVFGRNTTTKALKAC